MPMTRRSLQGNRSDTAYLLLVALLVFLLFVGGASRADVLAQVMARGVAALGLALAFLFAPPPSLKRFPAVGVLLLGAVMLPLAQLVPLPPGIWTALPGRGVFTSAATLSGGDQPWRPWSITPDRTANAVYSLMIPVTVFLLLGASQRRAQWGLVPVMLLMIIVSMLLGLVQLSGGGFDYPFINDLPGAVNGSFANRNHFALFLSFGCVICPLWAIRGEASSRWRVVAAIGLMILFLLTVLASGSRVGLVTAILGAGLGLSLILPVLRQRINVPPSWRLPLIGLATIALAALVLIGSVASGRSESIHRLMALEAGTDMRVRSLPTTLALARHYFPVGSGMGSFDPIFRMAEPFDLLKPTYFNHAHNDLLEVVIEGGLPAALLLALALGWWALASIQAWRAVPGTQHALPKVGSAILLLIIVASVFDYPVRTPLIMAMTVIAACWLSGRHGDKPKRQG